jgi:hypothetical protein
MIYDDNRSSYQQVVTALLDDKVFSRGRIPAMSQKLSALSILRMSCPRVVS